MKKILVLAVFFAAIQFSNAQIHWGLKGGVNYNSDSFIEVKDDIIEGSAKGKTGFHAGVWVRVKVPVLGVYVRPELVYTSLKSEVASIDGAANADYNFNKLDIPVLLGKKIFKIANIFVGPSFQYILDSKFKTSDADFLRIGSPSSVDTNTDGFTVGFVGGVGVELGRLGVDVRWERSFSDVESKLINGNDQFNFDTRVNQIIVGLSFRM